MQGLVSREGDPQRMANTRSPTEIAAGVRVIRDDLAVYFGNTGGGVDCIVATYKDETDEVAVYFGVATGNLGWSDHLGENYGDWDDLDASVYDAFLADEPLPDGDIIHARILAILAQFLPPARR